MKPTIDLSIIIPAYQEANIIGSTLEQLSTFLNTRDYGEVEVLVVVAHSPDGTGEIANAKAALFKHFRVIDLGQRAGKGRDVRDGMFEAKGRYRLFMDADLATPLSHLDDVYGLMQQDAKVIIAVRDLIRIHKGLVRKVMTKGANVLGQLLLLPGIKDTQCGFKAFEAEAAEAIFSRQTLKGWLFDMEVLYIARKLGFKIETIETHDWAEHKEVGQGLVGDSPLKAAVDSLLDLFRIRFKAWGGVYKHPNYQHDPKHDYAETA